MLTVMTVNFFLERKTYLYSLDHIQCTVYVLLENSKEWNMNITHSGELNIPQIIILQYVLSKENL